MVSKRGSPKRSIKKRSPKKRSYKKSPKRSTGSPSLNTRVFTASMFINSAERPKFKAWVSKNRSKLHPSMPPSKIISLYKQSKKLRAGQLGQSPAQATITAGLTSLEKALVFGTGTGLLTNNKGLGVGVGVGSYLLDRLNNNANGGCACGK